jgi:hypothetical protein
VLALVLAPLLAAEVIAGGSIAWEMPLKVFCSCEPRPVTVAAIAPAMLAAMRAYSMAVAPGSSFRKNRSGLTMFEIIERPKQHTSPGSTRCAEPGFIASRRNQPLRRYDWSPSSLS